ncbi:MAG TPA: DNA mismatch repair endonuclease MutL [Candidatus Cloacimonadota bacterium]|nr:DNA mismatch repair endonuclease MutL [Candidatus Cloacimonadota bacterium]
MSRIHILSEDVRNKIAAGEVIERPASVVKELVENSLDAGATNIVVSVDKGGKDYIQVTDNGIGMSEEDAMLAFERHSTSKIKTVEDIISIHSLGFRGEALPSIASVSSFSLVTKTAEAEMATRIEYANGRLINVSKTASNPGTTIIVKGLFKNIPARRKFLRSESAELKHILKYFHYQSIIYPQVSLKLIVDGREKLNYVSTPERTVRMADVFGSGFFTDDVIPVFNQVGEYSVEGFIFGLEDRSDKILDLQYVFVNGRFINDRTIKHAVKAAYEPFILKTRVWAKGSTPPYLIFVNVPPDMIDVNVHPTKQEVRFRESQHVHGMVLSTLRDALKGYEQRKFDAALPKFESAREPGQASFAERELFKSSVDIPRYSSYKKEFGNLYQPDLFKEPELPPSRQTIPVFNQEKAEDTEQMDLLPEEPNDNVSFRLIQTNEEDYINPWQLHNTYIFVQVEDGLVAIDQHAAHERIVYERLLHRTAGAPAVRQKLIVPIVIDIPAYIAGEIKQLLDQNLELLEKIGFVLKKFSGDSLVVEEIPAELGDWQGGKVFVEILKQLEEELEVNPDFRDSMAKSIACKSSIKAGHKLSRKEMLNLINELFACKVPYFCPHGRPVIIKMPLVEFEKRFKRLV